MITGNAEKYGLPVFSITGNIASSTNRFLGVQHRDLPEYVRILLQVYVWRTFVAVIVVFSVPGIFGQP